MDGKFDIENDKFVIGVVGTQNTGKTTMIKDIIAKYAGTDKEIKQVGCDYRKKIEEAGLSINRNGNLESQKIICDTLIEQLEIIKKMPSGNYITDRSPLDAYVYTAYLAEHNPELNITEEELTTMFNKMKEAMYEYDAIIFLDLKNCDNVVVVDDKFRDTNLEYRKEINHLFKTAMLSMMDEDYKDVFHNKLEFDICGDRDERVKMFDALYGDKLITNIAAKIIEDAKVILKITKAPSKLSFD